MSRTLQVAFVLSGVAGLVYEVLWTRYLGLYVGTGAYAQVLVLAVYLGGMALGAMILGDLSRRIADPVKGYAMAELGLAAFGLVFHPLFVTITDLSYDAVFPAIASASLVGSARWGLAGLMILPQAMLLGATFPLMAAGVVRSDPAHPGESVARVYLFNTLGGAAGVLLAGFWLIGAFGLPGTSVAAAVLNLSAAGLALTVARRAPSPPAVEASVEPSAEGGAASPWPTPPPGLLLVLLMVSFGTALASFAYEIGWIRMLSLALGSATHSFEMMLSAFILGIALGAWWIRRRADEWTAPLHGLGVIQVLMGLTAVVSVPLFYLVSLDAVAWLMQRLPGRTAGYTLFNLARYGLCLLVMLPSTVLAGMTLPLITGTLLRSGRGEEAIGRVYGVNTIGSVAGAGIAGLIALPWLGLKGLVLAGAAVDVALGLWLLERSHHWSASSLRFAGVASLVSVAMFAAVGLGLRFDRVALTSGVFRQGRLSREGEALSLYYADGRTATVSAQMGTRDGLISLSTNGKADASIGQRWRQERRDTLPDKPIEAGDYTTQILAPAVALAYRPGARTVANIGHGSGMTATAFLTSPSLQRIVTIEIEPRMLEGSLVFLPANGPAIADPRVSYVFDDAKSYFAYRREAFDIIFAEPSNPWVSGTSSLFTVEFYRRVTEFLSEGGVLAQWLQAYELDDELFMSAVAALDQVFPSYRAYMVADGDVAIVASTGTLPEPDWSVLSTDRFLQMTEGAPPFRPEHMEPLLLFDENTLRPLLDQGERANSDFHPVLDLGAERTRFEGSYALGVLGLAASRVDLPRLMSHRTSPPLPYEPVPAYGLAPAVSWGRAAWLRQVEAAGGGIAPEDFPAWQPTLVDLQVFLQLTSEDRLIGTWLQWAQRFEAAEGTLHWGTIGWTDTTFYRQVHGFLDRTDAPAEPRAVVDLLEGLSLLDWERAAAAADLLVPRVQAGELWELPTVLLDVSVLAYLRTGRPEAARTAYTRLVPLIRRPAGHLRNRLLDAMITEAERPGG